MTALNEIKEAMQELRKVSGEDVSLGLYLFEFGFMATVDGVECDINNIAGALQAKTEKAAQIGSDELRRVKTQIEDKERELERLKLSAGKLELKQIIGEGQS